MCRILFFWLVAASLTGCTTSPATQALLDAYQLGKTGEISRGKSSRLNPKFKYLRVQIDQREIILVLGYVDKSPDGPVEVWYSALGEVLRLREGRLIGATMNRGTDWLNVSFNHLPRWEQMGTQTTFERSRDVSPGYQYGIKEKIIIKSIAQPSDSQLKHISPASLNWFEESTEGEKALPPSRYGVNFSGGHAQVVYAEQCLSNSFCFSWQLEPVQKVSQP
jgi:hypothetical protein